MTATTVARIESADGSLLVTPQAGTGLVDLKVIGALAVFDVRSFGAKGDGITDDASAFQDAIDAAKAVKGIVFIPEANAGQFYRIGTTLDDDGACILGVGAGSLLKAKNGLNANVLNVTGSDLTLSDFVVDGNGANQVPDTGDYRGVYLTAVEHVTLRNVTGQNCNSHGLIVDNTGGPWNDVTFENCDGLNNGNATLIPGPASAQVGNGLTAVNGNDLTVNNCRGLGNVGDGFYFQTITNSTISNNKGRDNHGYGIELTTTQLNNTFTANVATGNAESGIGSDAIALMDGCTFVANVCVGNGGDGIGLEAGAANPINNTVVGNICKNNSTPGLVRSDFGVAGTLTVTLSRDGIGLSGVKQSTVVGNQCFDDQMVKTQRYPVSDGGGATASLFAGNGFPDNGLGGPHFTGSDNVIGNNNVDPTGSGGVGLIHSAAPDTPTGLFSDDGLRTVLYAAAASGQLVLRNNGPNSNNFGALLAQGAGGLREYFMGAAGELDTWWERAVGGIMSTARDVEVTDHTKGVVIHSPDGTAYRITVANGGALATVPA